MFKNIALSMLVVLMMSCGKPKEEWKASRSVVLDIGFVSKGKFRGHLYDRKSKETLLYFADPITDKVIKFFNAHGELTDTISLSKGILELRQIDGLSVISMDSIILINERGNQLCAIDKSGTVWHRLDLSQFCEGTGQVYYFSTSGSGNFVLDGKSVLLHPNWVRKHSDSMGRKVARTLYEDSYYFYSHWVRAPHLIKVENFLSSSPVAVYGLPDFYWNIDHNVAPYIDGRYSTYQNKHIFVFSSFSPYLLRVDPTDLNQLEQLRIVDDARAVAVPAPLAQDFDSKVLNFELQHKSIVGDFGYCSKSKKYLLIQTIDFSKNTEIEYRPFKAVIFDEGLQFEREVVIDQNKYLWHNSLIVEDGVYLLKNKQDENTGFGVKEYDFFEI
ncbi:hypothetical protein [Flavobacterium sp. JP2137]|uniref:hypothetical protein n=1 Tax=Flavobacterium sp. JP2137 TaxID=3414510 RepID=UPI003D300249